MNRKEVRQSHLSPNSLFDKPGSQKEHRQRRKLGLLLGLTLSLGLTQLAFEWKGPATPLEQINKQPTSEILSMEVVERTRMPEKVKIQLPKTEATASKSLLLFSEIIETRKELFEVEEKELFIDPNENYVNIDDGEEEEDTFDTGNQVYMHYDRRPEFPGGMEAFNNFLKKNIRYTQQAIQFGVEGKVTVSFVVEKDGSLTDIKIINGLGSGLDEVVIKALKNSPSWKPGMINDLAVRVQFGQQVQFQLP
jgi:TonB family protein